MNFKLLDYYIGSVEDINEENSQGIIDMYTDAWFAYGQHKTVDYLTRHGVIVFQYLFAYEGMARVVLYIIRLYIRNHFKGLTYAKNIWFA